MKTIPTIPIDDIMSQIIDRMDQEDYEQFVQAGINQYLKERAEQEWRDNKTEKSVGPGNSER